VEGEVGAGEGSHRHQGGQRSSARGSPDFVISPYKFLIFYLS
jgi:hypothetical protein